MRERTILAATALLAISVPVGAAAWVNARTNALAGHLGDAGGVSATIGGVDADLTGALRLSDVAFGDLIAVEAIEASVALDSLLSGQLRADEIQVSAPRVAVRVGADGDSDLAQLARRLAKRGTAKRVRAGGRLRRIVVSEGSLTAQIAGLGQVAADHVELVPDEGGVRIITGGVRVTSRGAAPVDVELAFTRSAAELSLSTMKFQRVLAVGGTGSVTAHELGVGTLGTKSVQLRDVAAGRLAPGGALEVHVAIDDGGIPRRASIELSPTDLAITVRGNKVPLGGIAALAPRGIVLDSARASGSLTIRRRHPKLTVEMDGSVENLVLDHGTIAKQRVPISAAIRTTVTLGPDALLVPNLELDAGEIHTRASGWLRRGSPISGQLDVHLASAPCADLLASLPAEVRGPLDGMVVAGDLGGSARLTVDLAAPDGAGTALTTKLAGGCETLSEPPAADVTNLTHASEHLFPDGNRALVGPGEPNWIPMQRIPQRAQGAFVSAEDGRFWSHNGFDIQQIARSLEIDLRERRLARGGSTISQQLIKNAFLTHRRTFDRKVQEAILTWRLEARLDKKQILERYLNVIELGPKLYGIGPAARYWFDNSPRSLTTRQIAFLAAITSEPTSMSRRIRKHGGLDPQSADRVATILRAMRRDGVIGDEDFAEASVAPMFFTPEATHDDR